MLREQFETQLNRLKATFGSNNFTGERIELIFKAISSLTHDEFKSIVNHFISSSRQAPLPKDFYEAAVKERNSRIQRGQVFDLGKDPYQIKCAWCADSGVLNVKHKASQKEYFVRCGCTRGQEQVWNLPTWTHSFKRDFDMLPMDAGHWKPKRFNPDAPMQSLTDKIEEWKLKVAISRVFWTEHLKSELGNGVSEWR